MGTGDLGNVPTSRGCLLGTLWSGYSRGPEPVECMYNEKGIYSIGWQDQSLNSPTMASAGWSVEKSAAAWSMRLGAGRRGRDGTPVWGWQPRSFCKITAGVWCSGWWQRQICTFARRCVYVCTRVYFSSTQVPSLFDDGTTCSPGGSFPSVHWPACWWSLQHPTDSKKPALPIFQATLSPIKLTNKVKAIGAQEKSRLLRAGNFLWRWGWQ